MKPRIASFALFISLGLVNTQPISEICNDNYCDRVLNFDRVVSIFRDYHSASPLCYFGAISKAWQFAPVGKNIDDVMVEWGLKWDNAMKLPIEGYTENDIGIYLRQYPNLLQVAIDDQYSFYALKFNESQNQFTAILFDSKNYHCVDRVISPLPQNDAPVPSQEPTIPPLIPAITMVPQLPQNMPTNGMWLIDEINTMRRTNGVGALCIVRPIMEVMHTYAAPLVDIRRVNRQTTYDLLSIIGIQNHAIAYTVLGFGNERATLQSFFQTYPGMFLESIPAGRGSTVERVY